jgi:RNA polymerase sigma factor (sigma-70 family)
MTQAASRSVVRQIESVFDGGSVAGLSDRQLIDRFNARRDAAGEAAFAAIVRRHGPMVLEVCQQLLGDLHHAEDAFQAVFFVLARKTGKIRDPDLLSTWLYGVALRTARKSRSRLARLRQHEGSDSMEYPSPGSSVPVESTLQSAEESAIGREQAEALHDEIDRLPKSFRLPVVLCYFEGLTLDEVARRLHWPAGTVRSRLARARDKLRVGLTRRGVVLPAAAIVAALSPKPAAASVSSALCDATTRAAIRFIAGQSVSASTSTLAREVLRFMGLSQLKLTAVTVLALAAVATGGGFLGHSLAMKDEPIRGKPVRNSGVIVHAQAKGTGKSQPPPPAQRPPAPGADKRGRIGAPKRRLSPWGEQVDRAIRGGVRFLEEHQRPDGSWPDVEGDAKSGMTSLATLAFLAAGKYPDSPFIRKALEFLRRFGPNDLNSTYAIALQTMVFAAAEPERDKLRIVANVDWLERAQIKPGDPVSWPGSWTYTDLKRGRHGDNSNSQYALLGLHAADEAGVPVKAEVWALARAYWERCQKKDGSWAYTPDSPASTASMTCAGISSLIVSGLRRHQGREFIRDDAIENCGKGGVDTRLQSGIDWLAAHFQVGQNFGGGQQWKLYYLHGLERTGRLAGVRLFGAQDWYRLGAEELLHEQDRSSGCWRGALLERDPILATSFALLFLAKGRAPVLINKLRHTPVDDWNLDPDDVRNIVDVVSRDWKHPLTWQVVDSRTATVPDLRRARILFFNGHRGPEFSPNERKTLRDYLDQGGFLFAEACCGEREFDQGFRRLMKEIFPEDESSLRPLPESHPLWRARNLLDPISHPLWGIQRGARTVVVYSPKDLSCYWNQADQISHSTAVFDAIRVGQNVIDYFTGRQFPPDKLEVP